MCIVCYCYSYRHMDQAAIEDILQDRYDASKQALGLYHCPQSWQQILHSQPWHSLKALNLQSCQITDSQLQQTLSLTNWQQLQQIQLTQNRISGRGLHWMLEARLTGLVMVNLSGNFIGGVGVGMLGKVCMPGLRDLWIRLCGIGSQGARQLTKGAWPVLHTLNIYDNKIQLDGYNALKLGKWPQLNTLWVDNRDDQTLEISSSAIEIITLMDIQPMRVQFDMNIVNKGLLERVKAVLDSRHP